MSFYHPSINLNIAFAQCLLFSHARSLHSLELAEYAEFFVFINLTCLSLCSPRLCVRLSVLLFFHSLSVQFKYRRYRVMITGAFFDDIRPVAFNSRRMKQKIDPRFKGVIQICVSAGEIACGGPQGIDKFFGHFSYGL